MLPLTTSYQYFCFSTINVHFCHIFSFVSKTGKHDNYFNLAKQLLFAGPVLPGKSGKHGKSGQIYGAKTQVADNHLWRCNLSSKTRETDIWENWKKGLLIKFVQRNIFNLSTQTRWFSNKFILQNKLLLNFHKKYLLPDECCFS